jgi:hypothetical protein
MGKSMRWHETKGTLVKAIAWNTLLQRMNICLECAGMHAAK